MTLVEPDLSVLAEPATVVVTSGTSITNSLRGEAIKIELYYVSEETASTVGTDLVIRLTLLDQQNFIWPFKNAQHYTCRSPSL